MTSISSEDLRRAYRKEKDPRVLKRMAAASMVCMRGDGIQETADRLMQCPNWVAMWVERSGSEGPGGLRDLPRTGRPPRIPQKRMDRIMKKAADAGTTPAVPRQDIHKRSGIRFHITYVRKLMHRYGLSPKTPRTVHTSHAGKNAVKSRRYRLRERILCLKLAGLAIAISDESFLVHDPKKGRKYWSRIGKRIVLPHAGNHKRVAACGAVADDGRQLFRTHERSSGLTFPGYARELRRRWGRVAIPCGRAPPYGTAALAEFVAGDPDVKIIYLPKGSPYLNAAGGCRVRGRYDLMASGYYDSFAAMCTMIGKYYRTTRFRLDMFEYLYRSPTKFLKNFCF